MPATYAPDFTPLEAHLTAHPDLPRDGWQYMGHHGEHAEFVSYRRRERPDKGQDRMYLNLPAA